MSSLITRHLASAGFESARTLNNIPHGHSFEVLASAEIDEPSTGDEWQEAVASACAALSYSDLNKIIEQAPTDKHLIQWLHHHLSAIQLPSSLTQSMRSISLKSAPQTYTHWTVDDSSIWLTRSYQFEAAHQLPNVPLGHKCGRMHGHGFSAAISLRGSSEVETTHPHREIDQAWTPLHEQLHLRCLNDIPGLENPTSEHLALWLWEALEGSLDLVAVAVNETPTAGCVFNGQRMRIWKEQTFDSAVMLSEAPKHDPRRNKHGHTFKARLHLTGSLDEVLGWVYDYGDIKTAFSPVFDQLDHRPLYDIEGLAHADSQRLARYIYEHMKSPLTQLSGVDVEHQTNQGVWLREANCFDL